MSLHVRSHCLRNEVLVKSPGAQICQINPRWLTFCAPTGFALAPYETFKGNQSGVGPPLSFSFITVNGQWYDAMQVSSMGLKDLVRRMVL